jgi:hypothetical protein
VIVVFATPVDHFRGNRNLLGEGKKAAKDGVVESRFLGSRVIRRPGKPGKELRLISSGEGRGVLTVWYLKLV